MEKGEEKLSERFSGMCPWRFKIPQPLTYRSCGEKRRRGFSTTLLYVPVIGLFWVKRGSFLLCILLQLLYCTVLLECCCQIL